MSLFHAGRQSTATFVGITIMRIGKDLWTTQTTQGGPHPGVDLKIMSQTNEGQPAPTNITSGRRAGPPASR